MTTTSEESGVEVPTSTEESGTEVTKEVVEILDYEMGRTAKGKDCIIYKSRKPDLAEHNYQFVFSGCKNLWRCNDCQKIKALSKLRLQMDVGTAPLVVYDKPYLRTDPDNTEHPHFCLLNMEELKALAAQVAAEKEMKASKPKRSLDTTTGPKTPRRRRSRALKKVKTELVDNAENLNEISFANDSQQTKSTVEDQEMKTVPEKKANHMIQTDEDDEGSQLESPADNDFAIFCSECRNAPQPRHFDSEDELSFHILSVHLNWWPYRCGFCEASASSVQSIRDHIQYFHPDSPKASIKIYFTTDHEKYSSLNRMIVESRKMSANPWLYCNYCEEEKKPSDRFLSENQLFSHVSQHLGYRKYHCRMCEASSHSLDNMDFHLELYHPNTEPSVSIKPIQGREIEVHEIVEFARNKVMSLKENRAKSSSQTPSYHAAIERSITNSAGSYRTASQSSSSRSSPRSVSRRLVKESPFIPKAPRMPKAASQNSSRSRSEGFSQSSSMGNESVEGSCESPTSLNFPAKERKPKKSPKKNKKAQKLSVDSLSQSMLPMVLHENTNCALCGLVVTGGAVEIEKHVRLDHMGDPKSIFCRTCGSGYGRRDHVVRHMKKIHKVESINEEDISDMRQINREKTKLWMARCFGNPEEAEAAAKILDEEEEGQNKENEDDTLPSDEQEEEFETPPESLNSVDDQETGNDGQ